VNDSPLDRLLRMESLVALGGLTLVAVLVALGARWRTDPRRAGSARAINTTIRVGFIALVVAIVLFFVILAVAAWVRP
jgi:energy-converting hydrogenase Eha subunit B